jgi:hypothetical protein
MTNEKVFAYSFANIYTALVQKAARKGRTQAEVDEIIFWLTGYDADGLQLQLDSQANLQTF